MQLLFQVLLFLLAAVPCGIPFRYNPNPVFPSELAAVGFSVLLIMAGSVLPSREGKSSPPWSALIWLGMAVVILIQCVALPVPYWSERTTPIVYFVTAGLLVWSLARARDVFGYEPLLTAFALGLLTGALFNTGVAMPQVIHVLKVGEGLVFGNIGQKNMYGHYLAWGMAAACWLAAERKLPMWLFGVLMAWLALSLAWCGSRSPFMYGLAWLGFGALLTMTGKNTKRFGILLVVSALLIFAMQFIAPLISDVLQHALGAKNDVPTGLARLDSNGSRRLVEWHKAWLAFMDNPVFGVGWSAYGAQSILYQVRPEFARVSESVLFTHAHNSLLNLMAETGVIGTAVVVIGLLWAVAGVWKRRDNGVAMLGTAMVIVSILHSLVEYPLWYAHLFLPFVLMLYLVRDDEVRIALPASAVRVVTAAAGLALVLVCVLGGRYYLQLYPILDPSKDATQNAANIRELQQLRPNPLVDYYADFALSNYIVPSRQDMAWKLDILDRLNTVRPYPGQLADAAVMHALKGQTALAHTLMRQAAFAYPESLDYFYQVIADFSKEPTVQALKPDVDEARKLFKDAHVI
ncbi:PglL family O-oligosaccharyltransferase [Andreprevotia chitinilytica]|uniref:PglL family O-oligosaccharyltransferase n=1 Tax=Andreprevotia chitinilytica TaxID=396808 RepID=UPI00055223B4|nr:PglL family O-oligosaccharyltransferase [Andreprevotia chitinilytica]